MTNDEASEISGVNELGVPGTRRVDDLLLDQRNPRLPERLAAATQEELAKFIDEHYDPLRIEDEINPHRRDGGVDVVAWRPFRDGRSAFPVVLAQTTLQTNYPPKAKDVSSSKWRDWIAFGSDPSTALVIPYVVPMGDHHWNDMRSDVNVIIDRLRLCELLEGTDAADDHELTGLTAWVQEQLARMALNP